MKSLLFTLSLLIFFSACNQQPKKVNAKLQISAAHLIAGQSGGVMLYVTNKALNAQRTIQLQNNEITLELDDGLWDFAVLAWAGGNGPLSGNLSCAKSSVELKSSDRVINLSLNPANCNDNYFAPAAYRAATGSQAINNVNLIDCQNISGLAAVSDCNSVAIGTSGSYKIHLLAYPERPINQLASLGFAAQPGISSNCITSPAPSSSITSTNFKIPVGSAAFQPTMVIESFFILTAQVLQENIFSLMGSLGKKLHWPTLVFLIYLLIQNFFLNQDS